MAEEKKIPTHRPPPHQGVMRASSRGGEVADFEPATLRPRRGDGRLEVFREGQGVLTLLLPLDGGGRLALEMPIKSAKILAKELRLYM